MFRIVGDVGSETVDDLSVVAIGAMYNFWGCHARSEALENNIERTVKELPTKFPELRVVLILAVCYKAMICVVST